MKTKSHSQAVPGKGLPRREFLRLSLLGSAVAGASAAFGIAPTQTVIPAVKIKQLSSEEAYAKMISSLESGDEVSLGDLRGILIAISLPKNKWSWDTEKCIIRSRFFTRPRIHRLLTAIKTREADDRTHSVINQIFGERGYGWMGGMLHSRIRGWFKQRALECFDPSHFSESVFYMATWVPMSLDEVIQYPLRDPFI